MRLDSLELREIALDLVAPFETSFGRIEHRRILLVAVERDGVVGWGECTASEGPFYNEEFTDSAWHAIGDFLAPIALAADFVDGADLARRFAHIRGNRMARAAVETAVWDLEAKLAAQPLWRYLGSARGTIACGVSIGLQPSPESLVEKVAREVDAGYQRIKLKIAPGRDVAPVAAVRERFPDILLSVDANGAYTPRDAAMLASLDRFDLLMIEQPYRPGDLVDHATLRRAITTPICLDESIVDEATALQAIELGSCDVVNIKLGRVGGHAEAARIAAACERARLPVWCGGMLESGVGRLQNAALATLSAFTLPGDVSDSRRYWRRDVVVPRPTVAADGTLTLSDRPGIGAEVDVELLDAITVRRETQRRQS